MKVVHKDSIPLGGFAGLKEHRLIVDNLIGGNNDTWNGIGNFVYLADSYFDPYGETKMHAHKELDVTSIMLEGNINHEGSLEHGTSLVTRQVQVQRAGGKGFAHNEINPNPSKNRMLQLWVLPENKGEEVDYKLYDVTQDDLTQIYGGSKNQSDTLDSHTIIEVGRFLKNKTLQKSGEFLAYVSEGDAILNNTIVKDGDLIHGTDLQFTATSDNAQIVIISKNLKDENEKFGYIR